MTAKKSVSKAQIARLQDYKSCFTSEHGARVLNDLILKFIMNIDYVPNDPYGMAFNDGARNVVMGILRNINITPQDFKKLTERALDHERSITNTDGYDTNIRNYI